MSLVSPVSPVSSDHPCGSASADLRYQALALAERDGRKDQFLAMLAHELRNPLAPITSAAQLLQLRPADAQQVLRSGRIIERQAGHLTALVDSLLDVSRVTHGLIQLKRTRLDPMTVVASAVEQMQPVIDAQRHALVVEGGARGTLVDGDAVRLTQVLVNLLHNAARYTPGRGQHRPDHRRRRPCADHARAR